MEAVSRYVVSVVACAMLCGILTRLFRGHPRQIIQVLCGVFFSIVLLQPVSRLGKISWEIQSRDWEKKAQALAVDGSAMAEHMKAAVIEERMQAYILNKAAVLGAAVEVSITLGENGIPASAEIAGCVSPGVKGRLTEILVQELGIPKEKQQWIG